MSRLLRTYDEAGFLHAILRGNDQQIVFIDDMDRRKFLKEMKKYGDEMGIDIIAYCLMSNHIHLVLHDEQLRFSEYMKKLEIAYVRYINAKYERSGHLFQDRFYSKVITTDSQLLCAIRYVHLNPQEAAICRFDQYAWSSYCDYFSNSSYSYCNTELALGISGSRVNFKEFHNLNNNYFFEGPQAAIKDSEAISIICEIISSDNIFILKTFDSNARDEALSKMKLSGLSIRQISRLTGISRSVVQRS